MRRDLDLSLYLVLDPRGCAGRDLVAVAEAAAAGGATIVQFRDKTAETRALVETARRLKEVLAPHGVPLIVNDRVDVALAAGADGVHVGQADMDPADARRLIGDDAILGLTVRAMPEARAVPHDAVDYVSIGGVFKTATKDNPDPPIGVDGLRRLAAAIDVPKVAIAGITADKAAGVIAAGVDGVAVVSAVCAAADPRAAAAELKAIVDAARAGGRAA